MAPRELPPGCSLPQVLYPILSAPCELPPGCPSPHPTPTLYPILRVLGNVHRTGKPEGPDQLSLWVGVAGSTTLALAMATIYNSLAYLTKFLKAHDTRSGTCYYCPGALTHDLVWGRSPLSWRPVPRTTRTEQPSRHQNRRLPQHQASWKAGRLFFTCVSSDLNEQMREVNRYM